MGWNDGRNPLPFVLVEDVADAIARAALKPELSGRSLNLVGDVAMTAREYIEELSRILERPLKFHGQSPEKLYLVEWGKWGVKRLAGRKGLCQATAIFARGVAGPSSTVRTLRLRWLGARVEARSLYRQSNARSRR